jgi:hypothetical protein
MNICDSKLISFSKNSAPRAKETATLMQKNSGIFYASPRTNHRNHSIISVIQQITNKLPMTCQQTKISRGYFTNHHFMPPHSQLISSANPLPANYLQKFYRFIDIVIATFFYISIKNDLRKTYENLHPTRQVS